MAAKHTKAPGGTKRRKDRASGERRVLLMGIIDPGTWLAATRATGRAGWVVEAAPFNETPRSLIEVFGCDGILGLLPRMSDAARRRWRRCPVPVVDIGDFGREQGLPGVSVDLEACGGMAAEHFLRRGFRHLAYCLISNYAHMLSQLAGFKAAGRAAGAEIHVLQWPQGTAWTCRNFRQWIGPELARLPGPVGLFTDADWTGLEAAAACREVHLPVPERVAVLGCFNRAHICRHAPCPLSSVDTNPRQVVGRAVALLEALLRGKAPPKERILIPPRRVVTRQSTDILAVPDPRVSAAIRYIWDSYTNWRLSVEDIAGEMAISSRGLQKAFERSLGRSIGAELRRKRLLEATALLRGTDLKVRQVAERCGYRDAEHLRSTLKKHTGLGPQKWRRLAAAGKAPDIPFLHAIPKKKKPFTTEARRPQRGKEKTA